MTIENGNKSIDDCSPAEWDAARDKAIKSESDAYEIERIVRSLILQGCTFKQVAAGLIQAGFKRD